MDKKRAREIASEHLHSKRLRHCYGTASLAASIGTVFGEDPDKLYIAGMLHDIAKPLSFRVLLERAEKYSYPIDAVERYSPGLLHAPVGRLILEHEYGVDDPEILDAVQYHTTGKSSMNLFEKILYAADFFDPYRSFPEQRRGWAYMERDFHMGLMYICRYFIKKIAKKPDLLHPDGVDFFNDLVLLTQNSTSKRPLLRKSVVNLANL